MKYIIEYYRTYPLGYTKVYMIRNRRWTDNFAKATISDTRSDAAQLARSQFQPNYRAWSYIDILQYTDQAYFKRILRG